MNIKASFGSLEVAFKNLIPDSLVTRPLYLKIVKEESAKQVGSKKLTQNEIDDIVFKIITKTLKHLLKINANNMNSEKLIFNIVARATGTGAQGDISDALLSSGAIDEEQYKSLKKRDTNFTDHGNTIDVKKEFFKQNSN